MKYTLVKTIVLIWICQTGYVSMSDPIDDLYQEIKKINNFDSIHALVPSYEEQASQAQLGKLYFLIGWKYGNTDNFGKAFEYYNKSRKIYHKIENFSKEEKCLDNLGSLAMKIHQYDKASKYFHEAWEINKEIGDEKEIALSLFDIGLILSKTPESRKEAIWYLLQSTDLLMQINEFELLSKVYFKMGVVNQESGFYSDALDCYYLALGYAPESEKVRAKVLNNYSEILQSKGDYDGALLKLDSAMVIKRKLGDERLIISSLNTLGVIHYEMGHYEKAYDAFLESFTINSKKELKQHGYQNLYKSYTYMDSIGIATGDESRLFKSGVFRVFKAKEAIVMQNLAAYHEKDLMFQGELIEEKEELAAQGFLIYRLLVSALVLMLIVLIVLGYYIVDKRKREASKALAIKDIRLRLEKYM